MPLAGAVFLAACVWAHANEAGKAVGCYIQGQAVDMCYCDGTCGGGSGGGGGGGGGTYSSDPLLNGIGAGLSGAISGGIQSLFSGPSGPSQADIQAAQQQRAMEIERLRQLQLAEEARQRKFNADKDTLLRSFKGSDSKRMSYDLNDGESIKFKDPTVGFDSYHAWEKRKEAGLKRQRQLTAMNAENKERESWCKLNIPLYKADSPRSLERMDRWACKCGGDCTPSRQTAGTERSPAPIEADGKTPGKLQFKDPVLSSGSALARRRPGIPERQDGRSGAGGVKPEGPGSKGTGSGDGGTATEEALTDPAADNLELPKDASQIRTLAGEKSEFEPESEEKLKVASNSGIDTKGPLLVKNAPAPAVNLPPEAVEPERLEPTPRKAPPESPVRRRSRQVEEIEDDVPAPPPIRRRPSVQVLAEPEAQAPTPAKMPSKQGRRGPSQKAVAERQARVLNCAVEEILELANGMGESGAALSADLKKDLEDIRAELSKPCSGEADSQNIQSISLSDLTRGAKKKEDHLEGAILVSRDEETCEVHLDVQFASSANSRRSGHQPREGQSIIRMDKTGKILDQETSEGVGSCLAR